MEGEVGVVDRWQRGRDREAVELFDRHYQSLCRLAFVILGDPEAAEEVVMDALVKTFSGWGRLRDPSAADVYLKRAVVNGCRSKLRRRAVERRYEAGLRLERAPSTEGPDAGVERDAVWRAVLTLPLRQRACVVLRYYEDHSAAQIADVMNTSIGTVKSQLAKAREKLEIELGETSEDADGS